ncbi:DUF1338 domain-containing protein [Planktothrix sp. FACHB-1355]|uniref:2-oxoadipate dioxygenase/decarboxylase n=1 Tax=Aerosakkonema funiforme FACHB-1375 TaxID=2949571 RepID=A0A926VF87_9CYAN|nr:MULTISPECIES: DUF1338 domain-containing protein [Oscillatoriales]MBD2181439.1 DUF1338 domain-containing protein [Aerosakkonema funiforme FACHB-1375]MBD3558706.1 DUF1338 domain-containing protein [Planktothrix sp. FACHB-1355]
MSNIEVTRNLWHKLWEKYSARVSYAKVYQQMITEAGGVVANDHIAFRSLGLNVNGVNLGIPYLERIVESLGYSAAGEYVFADKHLYARHYRHPEQEEFDLPKLFISELIVDELPDEISQQIYQTVSSINSSIYPNLSELEKADVELIVNELENVFDRPWQPPVRSSVEAVNKVTQYGAWVLLHGYAVNHFTGYVNRQNTDRYPDIETTVRGLSERGVPMKAEIEGTLEIGLRQTATQAVTEMVTVRDDTSGELISIPWTYAYYEIAERFLVEIGSGQKVLFDAFQGNNATHLFEMTKLSRGTRG